MPLRNPISQIRQRNIRGNSSPYQFDFSQDPEAPPQQMGGWNRRDILPDAPQVSFEAPPVQNEGGRYYDEIERIRNSAGPGISAYKQALSEVPTQEEYKPNAMTRIAATLGGISAGLQDAGKGIAVAQGMNSSNYRQAMSEYNNRLGTLQEQAEMERDDMKTRLDGLYKAKELGLKYDEYAQKRDAEMHLDATRTKTADAAMISARARADAAAKTDWSYEPIQGGYLAINENNPADRQMIPAKTIQDAQLAVSKRVAATGEKNADTNAKQIPIQQQNADTAASNMGINAAKFEQDAQLEPRRVAAQEANAGVVRAPEQQAAYDLAQKEMMDEQEWSRFFGTNWRGKPLGPDDFDPADWQLYQEELKARMGNILANPRRR